MKIRFQGAAGGVTGSSHLVEAGGSRVLLDFGLYQGGPHAEAWNRRKPDFHPETLDAVVLSHAHIDHSGRLPLLGKLGGRAPIFCTRGTADLAAILLPDSAHLQAHDAERWSRKRGARGRPPVEPLYDMDDVKDCLDRLAPQPYGRDVEVAPGIVARFRDAGHILGSAIVQLELREGTRRVRLVYSGDLGHAPAPILRDPERIEAADVLLMESTYGDRNHKTQEGTLAELRAILADARRQGGKVIIPAFAVGRTQDLIYHLAEMWRAGELPDIPVIVDSPMATSTTELYRRHKEVFDAKARAILEAGDSPLDFSGLRFTRSTDESRALNDLAGPAVIISASGMCSGGRVVHHLKHHATRRGTQLVFVGYQAQGTPGRAIVDGHRNIRLFGENVQIRAEVHTLGGFSAHAGQDELVSWAGAMKDSHPKVFLVHGEDKARETLRDRLAGELLYKCTLPLPGQAFEL